MLCLTPLAKLNTNCNNLLTLKKCPLMARENMEWGWFAKNTTNMKTVLTMKTDNPVTCGIEHTFVNKPPMIGNAQYDVYCLIVFIVSWCFYSHANKPKLRHFYCRVWFLYKRIKIALVDVYFFENMSHSIIIFWTRSTSGWQQIFENWINLKTELVVWSCVYIFSRSRTWKYTKGGLHLLPTNVTYIHDKTRHIC